MDACCQRIADLLCQGGQSSPRSLVKLDDKTGLARSSVMRHMKHLEREPLVVREEILQGPVGRPKMLSNHPAGFWSALSRLDWNKFLILK